VNPSTALARTIVDELVRGGVREAVLAPGSRSAPFALALHAADSARQLRLHVRIDERSAGFLAVGLAKAAEAPVAVVTTSGTATANLHPAVLEAAEAGVALVVLTADRPPDLRQTGANQTVDQIALYGSAVRLFHEVGAPAGDPGELAYWRALVARALASARGVLSRDPGPVHLNIAFRAPLLPEPADDLGVTEQASAAAVERSGRPEGAAWTVVSAPGGDRPVDDLPARTLMVVGDAPPRMGQQALLLAESRGWPVLSEPSGNARRGPHALTTGPALVGVDGFLDVHRPERLLVVGRPTLDRAVLAMLRRVPYDVVADSARWADPVRGAARVLPALPQLGTHSRRDADPAWLAGWQGADRAARAALDALLDAEPAMTEPLVARDLSAALPAGALLFAGSSGPVRDLYLAAAPREGVTVLANRGASGIDGTVSAAVGAALAWQAGGGGHAYALLGDLAFLHDATGLVLGPDEPRPDLTVVVLDNDGGGIFGLLEPGEPAYSPAFERVFGTPHGTDLAALCAATGTPHRRVSSPAELVDALGPAAGVRVVVVRTDRSGARALAERIRAAVASAVG